MPLGHGGSPEMLHRHYKGMATEAEAKAFWNIHPDKPANVVEYAPSKPEAKALILIHKFIPAKAAG